MEMEMEMVMVMVMEMEMARGRDGDGDGEMDNLSWHAPVAGFDRSLATTASAGILLMMMIISR